MTPWSGQKPMAPATIEEEDTEEIPRSLPKKGVHPLDPTRRGPRSYKVVTTPANPI